MYTGCSPDAHSKIQCASGVHPLYTRCTRREAMGCFLGFERAKLQLINGLAHSGLMIAPTSRI
jgi:hypothetical protein